MAARLQTWDYAGLLCNLYQDAGLKRYQDAGLKRYQHFHTSRAESPLNHSYTWCNMLLTGLHHSSVVSIPLLLPSISSIFPFHLAPLLVSLMCTRVRDSYHHHLTKVVDFQAR